MDPSIQIITTIFAAVLASAVTFLLSRIYNGNPLIPGSDAKSSASYKQITGKWTTYHITSDSSLHPKQFWQKGHATLDITSRGNVTGEQSDHNSANDVYEIRGKIKSGQLFMSAIARNDEHDNYLAHFHNLRRDNILCGLWVGVNADKEPFSGIYVLVDDDKFDANELNQLAKTCKLKACSNADTVFENNHKL
jgi:hypothetical protein